MMPASNRARDRLRRGDPPWAQAAAAQFLYDWWPLARRIRVYKTLKRAHVRVVQGK